jgi:hypothetical protein
MPAKAIEATNVKGEAKRDPWLLDIRSALPLSGKSYMKTSVKQTHI